MSIGNLRVSRWVLAPEMAMCFVPLTMGWLDVVFGGSGIVRLDLDVIQRYFLGVPGGTTVLVTIIVEGILGMLGPIGLILAFRLIAFNRPIRNRSLGTVLVVGCVLLGVVYMASQLILGSRATLLEQAGPLVLFAVLPAVGAMHMTHLGSRAPDRELIA